MGSQLQNSHQLQHQAVGFIPRPNPRLFEMVLVEHLNIFKLLIFPVKSSYTQCSEAARKVSNDLSYQLTPLLPKKGLTEYMLWYVKKEILRAKTQEISGFATVKHWGANDLKASRYPSGLKSRYVRFWRRSSDDCIAGKAAEVFLWIFVLTESKRIAQLWVSWCSPYTQQVIATIQKK